jgi:RING-variant domain
MKEDRSEGMIAAAASPACFDDDISCRICLEPSTRSEVIAPCSCRGSSKWVHRECLDKWRTTREDKAFSKCTECLLTYTLIARVDDSYQPKLMRRAKFFFLVLRDFTIAFLLLQLLIVGLSTIVYASDFFPAATHSKLFYYCAGLVIFLSVLGMLYFLGYSTSRMNHSGDCTRCCEFCCRSCSMASPLNDGSCVMCMDCGGTTRVDSTCHVIDFLHRSLT